MGKYFVVKGLPQALIVEKHFITGKIKFIYEGKPLFEITKGEIILDFPDGTKKTLTYKKSIFGFEYPRIFVDEDEIRYLIPLSMAQRIITALPAIMILTNGLIGFAFALVLSMLFNKIFKSMENKLLAFVLNLSLLAIVWVIATIISYQVFLLFD